jgi:hypothetical protein
MYFILGGILDGKAGFAWCTLQAFYEYLILLKVDELKANRQSQPFFNDVHRYNHDFSKIDPSQLISYRNPVVTDRGRPNLR